MDGLFSAAPKVSSATTMPFVGILYAEDFDDPAEPDVREPQEAQEAKPPAITQADVEAACADAVKQARAEWEAAQEQARQKAIASISETLGGMRNDIARASLEIAEGTVKTILAMVGGLLPNSASGMARPKFARC